MDDHCMKHYTMNMSRSGVLVNSVPLLSQDSQNNPDNISPDWIMMVNGSTKQSKIVLSDVPPALVPITDLNDENGGSVPNISLDLLDQQQNKEQAKLLQRFKQLKEWQKQQQEKLIRQQREQLHVLRSEQERVQSILTAQRHKQWGGGMNVLSPRKQKSGLTLRSSRSPSNGVLPSSRPLPLKTNSGLSPSSGVSFSQTVQPQIVHKLLNLPQREQPCDLDSTGEAPHSDTEDGFYPLPETSSETSIHDMEDRQRILQNVEKDGIVDNAEYEVDNCEDYGEEHHDGSIHNSSEVCNEVVETEENVSNILDDFDNQPVSGNGKQFEELLEQKLKLETEEQTHNSKTMETKPKRTFLKKGQGISRFGMKTFRLKKKESTKLLAESTGNYGNNSTKQKNKIQEVPQISRKVVKPATFNKPQIPSNKLVLKPETKPKVSPVTKTTVVMSPEEKVNFGNGTMQVHAQNELVKQIHTQDETGFMAMQPDTSKSIQKKTELPLDDTLEISFQNKVQDWQVRIEEEKDDLDEFELLEQAADDNASFSSNASLVVKVMKRAALKNQRLSSQCESELKDKKNGSHPEAPVELNQVSVEKTEDRGRYTGRIDVKENDFSNKDETRREGGSPTEEEDDEEDDTLEDNESDVLSDVSPKMKRITAGQNRNRMELNSNDEAEEETPMKGGTTSTHAIDIDFDDDESWGEFAGDQSSSDDESITAGDSVIGTNISTNKKYLADVLQQQNQSSLNVETINQENEPSSVSQHHSSLHSELNSNAPHTAELASKLFPMLKKHMTDQQMYQQSQLQQAQTIPLGQGVQSKLLRDKLTELETEIERFRTENAALASLRTEREKDLGVLKEEIATFEKQKNEELKSLEEFKKEETKKLKKERRNFEKYQQAIKTMPDKKGREEIERLKEEIAELQEELSSKEKRWTASSGRLRKRIEVLEAENYDLREEVKLLEEKRLESLKQDSSKKKMKKRKSDVGSKKSFQSLPEVYLPSSQPASTGELQQDNVTPSQVAGGITVDPSWQEAVCGNAQNGPSRSDKSKNDDMLSSEKQLPRKRVTPIVKNNKDEQSIVGNHGESLQPTSAKKPVLNMSPDNQPRPHDWSQSQGSDVVTKNKDSTLSEDDGTENSIHHSDGKVEHVNKDGSRLILFKNGTRKDISADGETITVTFFNGDIKQILPDQRVIYYYQETQTTHTTYQDGLEILQFANNQTEKHYPDGTKEITFPDQTIKYLFPNGREESIFGDGTVLRMEPNGDKVMEFANGQREVHTSQYKKREYPDGTIKTVYPDGRQETRYSTGRIRVKDKDGKIIVDQRT